MKKSLFDRGFSGPMLAILAIVATLPGCASGFDLRKSMPWAGSDDKIHEPLKVSVFWSEEVENRADMDRGVRGFGGRLYFYGKDPDKVIKVKGDLVIYAFDETNRDPKNMRSRSPRFRRPGLLRIVSATPTLPMSCSAELMPIESTNAGVICDR